MEKKILDITAIKDIIPHRFPFLLVDKIIEVELEPVVRAVGIKNVTINEPFFQGHFPSYPVMPGVLIVEALAQTACVAGLMIEENKGKIPLFTGIDNLKFRRQVVPGDTLKLEVEFTAMRRGMGKANVRASVREQTAAEGIIKFAIIGPKEKSSYAVFAISDLHLALAKNKPMDIFDAVWENYMEHIQENWIKIIRPDDLVLIPGDLSWATYIEDSGPDFIYIESLPGKKIISKGNHDYWWTTHSKLNKFKESLSLNSITFLHNNAFFNKDLAIVGTRGWKTPEEDGFTADDEKIYNRELRG